MSWFRHWSIRARIVLLMLTVLLPVAAMLAWLLATDLKLAREAGYARVTILRDHAAADVDRRLTRTRAILARLADRPLVKSLDPERCDPAIGAITRLQPEFGALTVSDLRGRALCTTEGDAVRPPTSTLQGAPWFEEAVRSGAFHAGDATIQPLTGRWVTMLTQPIRSPSGAIVGMLALPVDLLTLNEQLLASTPASAVVTVLDRRHAVLLHSADPAAFIGTRPQPGQADSAQDRREGLLSTTGGDRMPRVFAFGTVPGAGWRVSASLPETEVLADFRATRRRAAGIGAGVLLMALVLAWRLSAAIARPIAGLSGAAGRVAAGDAAARAPVSGPTEIAAVAQQFNHMLDAHAASERARRESEARYRTLVDWLPDGLCVHLDGKVLFVNPACVALLGGNSADDLVGRDSIDFIPPDLREPTLQQVNAAIEEGRPTASREQVFVKLDGSAVELEICSTPIDYGGRRALLVSMRDTTVRRRTEAALAASEELLRGIFETATVAILVADETQTIVKANPAAAAIFRCSVGELVGAPLGQLIPARHRAAHRADVQAFGETASAARHMGRQRDVMAVRADGAEFPIDAAISHLIVGGRRQYTVILRDITERHQAENALRDSEAGVRRLLRMLPDAVFVSSGNRISFVNEAAQRLFGADASALLGRTPLELIHPDSIEQARATIAALRAGATAAPLVEVKIRRADGSVGLVESTGTLVENPGESSIVLVMRSVTELSEARNALAESHAELRRLVAAQDRVQEDERRRIARELHDDLQQTLAAIRINLVAIDQRLQAGQSAAPLLEETGDLAAGAIESTRRIVNDLRPQMLEDLGLVPALEALVSQFARRTGIDCRFQAREGGNAEAPIPSSVANCLYRVTQEALGNADRHAQARKVRVRFTRTAAGRIMLRIGDDGRGMLTGQRRKPESFGLLGMHERVRALGATLHIGSRPGFGTMIDVIVPAGAGEAPLFDAAHAADAGVGARSDTTGLVDAMLPGIIDALDGKVAVLDRHGVILQVNRAWRAPAGRHGDPALCVGGPGANYLAVCRDSAPSDACARQALQGLTSVIEGAQESFTLEYPCDTPHAHARLRMHVAPIDALRILVTHTDITDRGGP
ncbi:MAG: PAS domain S-box protein [Burkholderiaceae bacterium]